MLCKMMSLFLQGVHLCIYSEMQISVNISSTYEQFSKIYVIVEMMQI